MVIRLTLNWTEWAETRIRARFRNDCNCLEGIGQVVGASGFEPPTSWSRIIARKIYRVESASDSEQLPPYSGYSLGYVIMLGILAPFPPDPRSVIFVEYFSVIPGRSDRHGVLE